MFDVKGKKVLLTGASGGIGKAIAEMLLAAGAEVTLSGTREEKLKALQGELKGKTHIAAGDLGSQAGIDAIIQAAEAAMGQIDVLVNNAGLTRDNLAMRLKEDDWQKVIDVNLTATFKLSQAVLRSMMKARWGRIINIASIVGVTGNPGQTNYSASKAGMIGMSKSLAAEVATRGITVNCVAPGFIQTAMTDVLTDDQKEKLQANIPAGRMGSPEDVAACVAFLASNEAGYVTGQTLHVNGGMAMI